MNEESASGLQHNQKASSRPKQHQAMFGNLQKRKILNQFQKLKECGKRKRPPAQSKDTKLPKEAPCYVKESTKTWKI